MSLKISDNGLNLIKRFEGCRLTAYRDSVGVWTIGYGHTKGVHSGQTISMGQATEYLRQDCANAERNVNSFWHAQKEPQIRRNKNEEFSTD